MKLSLVTSAEIHTVFQETGSLGGQATVEGTAQKFTELLYKRFEDSLVLTRLFATVPMSRLPRFNKDFVDRLADTAGISGQITDDTVVLTLQGSSGKLPEWNDRLSSNGHVGIPLASGKFVDSVPMMSRLLKEMGLDLDWINDWDTEIVSKGFLAQSTGMFYVDDAKTAVDHEGRKIISARDFVDQYGVKTVFGFGVGFVENPTLVVLISFTRETLDKSLVRSLIPVMAGFKRAAMQNVVEGKFFA